MDVRLSACSWLSRLRGAGRCWGCVDPSGVAVAGDVDADERPEGVRVDTVAAVPHDGPVDVAGDDQGQRVSCGAERLLDAGGIEEAEGDIEGFAEGSVAVVADFSGVHDDADPELAARAAGAGETGVVVGWELGEPVEEAGDCGGDG